MSSTGTVRVKGIRPWLSVHQGVTQHMSNKSTVSGKKNALRVWTMEVQEYITINIKLYNYRNCVADAPCRLLGAIVGLELVKEIRGSNATSRIWQWPSN